jgi:WD40 repeat protein
VAGTGGSTAGTGGATGTGGAGGGCTGTPGALPSLTCCREFDHLATAQVCDSNDTYLFNVAFSPDGTKLLTGGDDDRVKIWNFDGRTPTATGIALPASPFGFFAIAPNGNNVAVGDLGTVDIYLTSTWAFQRSLTTSGRDNFGIGFAPDSQRVIAIDYSDEITIHSITNPTPLTSDVATVFGNGLSVAPVQLASGLGVAVPGLDGDVSTFSVTGTSTLGTDTYFVPTGGSANMATAFSPDGRLLAVGDTEGNVRFWNFPIASATAPPTGATITIGEAVYGLAFSPNGQHVAITGGTSQGNVSIWSVATRSMVSRFNLPAGHFGKSVAFSPSGSALVVGEYGCGKITVCSY